MRSAAIAGAASATTCSRSNRTPPPPNAQFDNAYDNLTTGDFQEWQLGFELSCRSASARPTSAARNAELLLARERAILRDQQREVVHEAADAIAEMDRAYAVLQTSYNRLAASRDQLGAVQAAYDNGQSAARFVPRCPAARGRGRDRLPLESLPLRAGRRRTCTS